MKKLWMMTMLGVLWSGLVWAAKPRPEQKWHDLGKPLHTKAMKMKPGKERNRFCTAGCKKKGAVKARDLGACKESCFFGH